MVNFRIRAIILKPSPISPGRAASRLAGPVRGDRVRRKTCPCRGARMPQFHARPPAVSAALLDDELACAMCTDFEPGGDRPMSAIELGYRRRAP
jgi:hypothetical protein